ncbi:hypothetical protein BpHYR1_020971, partial [Brachionus plicatilis]
EDETIRRLYDILDKVTEIRHLVEKRKQKRQGEICLNLFSLMFAIFTINKDLNMIQNFKETKEFNKVSAGTSRYFRNLKFNYEIYKKNLDSHYYLKVLKFYNQIFKNLK